MRGVFVLLFATVSVFGQDPALARLKREMSVAREQSERAARESPPARDGGAGIAAVHSALRDWIEARLPKDSFSLQAGYFRLETSLSKELVAAGLSSTKPAQSGSFATLLRQVEVALTQIPELPETLIVTASLNVGCGWDQAVYVYRFDGNGRARIVDDHPKTDWGYGYSKFEISEADTEGRRLFLVHRLSIQCGSAWMQMPFAVYRLSLTQPPESLLSAEHGLWLGNGPEFVLRPDELMIEFLDRSVDVGVHNRTYLLRYKFGDGVKRLDPMAFQPQDFAEEWLTAPWSEMQSRSKPATQTWHEKKLGGEYTNVVLCASRPDRWSIGLKQEFDDLGKKLEVPIEVHLLVRDLGNYRYEMEEVSDSEFEGCPGEGSPSDKHPWLSVEQLKALP
jgi:hypothetical protein